MTPVSYPGCDHELFDVIPQADKVEREILEELWGITIGSFSGESMIHPVEILYSPMLMFYLVIRGLIQKIRTFWKYKLRISREKRLGKWLYHRPSSRFAFEKKVTFLPVWKM